MIQLPFDSSQINRAKKLAEQLGVLKNSITKGDGNFCAYLGEIALAKYLGVKRCSSQGDFYNRDIVYNGLKLEVKTKRRKAKPKEEYDVSIAATSKHQTPDIYAFLSLTMAAEKPLEIWLCGYYPRNKFFEDAVYWPKGKIDPSNGFRVHSSMYNITIKDLDKKIKKKYN
jgi:hypothetical protein